jgi:serine/threonine protein phosphatase PrpC
VLREDRFVTLPFASHLGCETDFSVFGVFDGHGGQRASTFASKRLPELLLRRLARSNLSKQETLDALRQAFLRTDHEFLYTQQDSGSFHTTRTPDLGGKSKSGSRLMALSLQSGVPLPPRPALSRIMSSSKWDISSKDTNASSQSSPPCVRSDSSVAKGQPNLMRRASSRAEDQVAIVSATPNPTCGTTATIILLSREEVFVAHVGDSRAILNCNGTAIRLFEDHRPSRKDEMARIESAGGLILKVGGAYRVNGALAVSRAIGDRGLKEFVVADPEIVTRTLTDTDDFLVVASDGLWDYVKDQECVDIAKSALSDDATDTLESAAKTLVEIACERGSSDDVSVIVIDLRQYRAKLLESDRAGEAQEIVENPRIELCFADLSMQDASIQTQNLQEQFGMHPDPISTPRNSRQDRDPAW